MKEHYERYGWVNFLKSVAATKVWDINNSGMNSIECARKTRCFDVLVYESEEKLLKESETLDYEAQNKTK